MALPDRLQFTIALPTPEGFLGRECNAAGCQRYFKVHQDAIRAALHCPYCGVAVPNDELWTDDQRRYLRESAARAVMPLVEQELRRALQNAVRGSKHLKFTPGRRVVRPQPQPPAERVVDSELTCPECHTRFQVDGIFGHCPGCRSENLRLYDANLAVIRHELAGSANRDRALRHAYTDLVATFETFTRKEAKRHGVDQGRFQNVEHTRRLFKDRLGVDILAGLAPDQVRLLKRVFEKRHVHEHNGGVVSERYVKEIPEDAALLGQRAPLSIEELEAAATILRLALERLVLAR